MIAVISLIMPEQHKSINTNWGIVSPPANLVKWRGSSWAS